MGELSMTKSERAAFLAEPHVAVLSITTNDGRPPLAMPVFYYYEPDGNFSLFTSTQGRVARKTELIREAGHASLTIQKETFPYKYVRVETRLVSIEQPPSVDAAFAVIRRYMPEDEGRAWAEGEVAHPAGTFTLITLSPERWDTSDLTKAPS